MHNATDRNFLYPKNVHLLHLWSMSPKTGQDVLTGSYVPVGPEMGHANWILC